MKKQATLVIAALTAAMSIAGLLYVVGTTQEENIKTKADPVEYSLTLDSTKKLSNYYSTGTGTVYTANENPIDISYREARWNNANDFVTFNEDSTGKIFNETAISGITKIEIEAAKKASTSGIYLEVTFSTGKLLNNPSVQTTQTIRESNLLYNNYKTFTFTPSNQSIYNYFTIVGSNVPLISDTISIKSMTIYYSCAMTKSALNVHSDYVFDNIKINNEDKEYAEFDVGQTAQISLTYETDEYEFRGWSYKDNYDEIFSTANPLNYTVDNSTGSHYLTPHFAQLDLIQVRSNHSSLGDAAFSDKDNAKRAYENTEYTVVATLEDSNVEEGFFPAFDGWYLDGVKVSSSLTYTFTVPVAGAAYEMVARFGQFNESFNQGTSLWYEEYWLENWFWRETKKDSFVCSYDGAYYGFDSKMADAIYGPREQSRGVNNVWSTYGNGIAAYTPYLALNVNHNKDGYCIDRNSSNKATVKKFDPNKVACIEFYFEINVDKERFTDDLSISGGASEFALTQKNINDPIDGKKVSKYCLTNFTTDQINIGIGNYHSDADYFRLKRFVVHYKIGIN